MHALTHDIISGDPSGPSSRRTMIIGSVAMLHVVIVYALVSGMAGQTVKYISHEITARVVDDKTKTADAPPPPKPVLVQPHETVDTIPPPVIAVANDQPPPITLPQTPANNAPPAQPDTGASGVSSTHSTPPYPAVARLAAHQGTVTLQLVISAQGDVASASVIRSSGFPELDQAAVAWVQAHWKYKPAMQNGAPVPSQAQAAVKFDLKQARL
ncbi:MAG: TonB family protein [Rhizomicrobium sp.]